MTTRSSRRPVATAGALLAGLLAAVPPLAAAELAPAHLAMASGGLGTLDGRYWAVRRGGVLTLTNPRQQLAARISAAGVAVSGAGGEATLRLASQGCEGRQVPVAPAEPAADHNRVELVRGDLVEWYVNGPLGIEQGFTVAAPALGCADGEELILELVFGVRGEAGPDGRSLSLSGAGLRYSGLAAFDAAERELPASLDLVGGRLRIRVDTAGARWPIIVDPLFENARLVASDRAAGDFLGSSIGVSGTTVVVGAALGDGGVANSGAAYVFTQPAGGWSGTLVQATKLIASDGVAFDDFGGSVAISGGTVAIGARFHDTGSVTGLVYVFNEPAGGWTGTLTENATLLASDAASFDNFGSAVAVDGDTLVVGASGDDDNGLQSGSAYVFIEPGTGWTGNLGEDAKLVASDGATGDLLGAAVSIAVDTVVVGAYSDDDNGVDSGSAYVFTEPAGGWSGTLAEDAKLIAAVGGPADLFGLAVAVSGDTVVVGAQGYDDNGNDSGAAFVYLEPAGGWSGLRLQDAKLLAADGAAMENFGHAVAVFGPTVAIGAYVGSGVAPFTGAVYRFTEPPGGWSGTLAAADKLIASDGDDGAQLGVSVALDGGALVAGARRAGDDDSGAAYVFAPGRVAGVVGVPALGPWGGLLLCLALAAAGLATLRRV